jgi:hypothetical protein
VDLAPASALPRIRAPLKKIQAAPLFIMRIFRELWFLFVALLGCPSRPKHRRSCCSMNRSHRSAPVAPLVPFVPFAPAVPVGVLSLHSSHSFRWLSQFQSSHVGPSFTSKAREIDSSRSRDGPRAVTILSLAAQQLRLYGTPKEVRRKIIIALRSNETKISYRYEYAFRYFCSTHA